MIDVQTIRERENASSLTWTGSTKKQKMSTRLREHKRTALQKSSRDYTVFVNEYFMMRAKIFLDTYLWDVLDLEYYWGHVEFVSGRGQIHMHILGIAKNKAYLHEFYHAESEDEKVRVLESYATNVLGMTADIEFDPTRDKYRKNGNTNDSPLGTHFSWCSDPKQDHIHLAQDSMMHKCNDYCLGETNTKKPIQRNCRMGFGTEATPNEGDTTGKDMITKAQIERDARGIEHLHLP